MRFIDLNLVIAWPELQALRDAAEAARVAVSAIDDADTRRDFIRRHHAVWTGFRPLFESVFGAKCWYTESANPGTDDDIDHFRPKGAIAEREDHGGYWWEAFNWMNLRLSCHRANRLRVNPETGTTHGKGNHFPLLTEDERWMTPAEPNHECPALLDPTDPADPPLVSFSQDGRVALSAPHTNSQEAQTRFEISRVHLHLDWPRFVSDRRNLYVTILMKVSEGDKADLALRERAAGARDWMKTVSTELIRYTYPSVPYSRAAAAYVRVFRDRDWMKRNVIPHIPPEPNP